MRSPTWRGGRAADQPRRRAWGHRSARRRPSRDIDPPEQRLLDTTALTIVPCGPRLVADLAAAVGRRPVYLHLDCDVLEAGIIATGHTIPGGLSLADLHQACAVLALSEVVGVEIAELESPAEAEGLDALLEALQPLLDRLR